MSQPLWPMPDSGTQKNMNGIGKSNQNLVGINFVPDSPFAITRELLDLYAEATAPSDKGCLLTHKSHSLERNLQLSNAKMIENSPNLFGINYVPNSPFAIPEEVINLYSEAKPGDPNSGRLLKMTSGLISSPMKKFKRSVSEMSLLKNLQNGQESKIKRKSSLILEDIKNRDLHLTKLLKSANFIPKEYLDLKHAKQADISNVSGHYLNSIFMDNEKASSFYPGLADDTLAELDSLMIGGSLRDSSGAKLESREKRKLHRTNSTRLLFEKSRPYPESFFSKVFLNPKTKILRESLSGPATLQNFETAINKETSNNLPFSSQPKREFRRKSRPPPPIPPLKGNIEETSFFSNLHEDTLYEDNELELPTGLAKLEHSLPTEKTHPTANHRRHASLSSYLSTSCNKPIHQELSNHDKITSPGTASSIGKVKKHFSEVSPTYIKLALDNFYNKEIFV